MIKKTDKYKLLLLPLLLIVSLLPLLFIEWNISSDIKVLLPKDEWIDEHFDFLRNSQIGTIVAISIKADSEDASKELPKYAKKISNRLSSLSGVKSVMAQVDSNESIEVATFLFNHIPQLLSRENYLSIDQKISKEGLDIILKKHYEDMLRPGALFKQKMVSNDPLSLFEIPLERLQSLANNSGFKFKIVDSCLFSEDSRHMLIIVYTDIPVTDAEKGKTLHDAINSELLTITNELDASIRGINQTNNITSTPRVEKIENKQINSSKDNLTREQTKNKQNFSYFIMSGHRHAIANKSLLQHDIFITILVASIGFFLLFAFFFRDWRAFFVFLVPLIAMVCSVGLTITFFKEPSAIILGLGTTVIGIALDYGIHVFVASKHSGADRKQALINLRRPLIFSALTTLGVFWAFFFSGTPGYHQLAFASTCGIALSLLFAIVILPIIIPAGKMKSVIEISLPKFSAKSAKNIIYIWLIFVISSVGLLFLIEFDLNIRNLDGIGEKLKQDEAQFRKIWGENKQAAITLLSDDLEFGIEKQDQIANFAKNIRLPGFQSLSLIWPSLATRKMNSNTWDDYWKNGKEDLFRNNFTIIGGKYSFSKSAFNPFFNKLYKHDFSKNLLRDSCFELFSKKFINYEGDKIRVTSFFDDDFKMVDKVKKHLATIDGCEVISPKSFGLYISKQIISDALYIAGIALSLIAVFAYFCLRNLRNSLVALVPVISATLISMPLFMILGLKINAVALVATIVVTGLAIDYGIFAVSACVKNEELFSKDAFTALTLSMLSTAIGAAALLWAGHPALRTVGLVISSGVLAGYLSAIFVSPALYKLIRK